MRTAPRVHVLACGVLAADLHALAPCLSVRLTLDLLPGKLHNTPHELRRRLQERIDAVSAAGGADAIAIVYGICGRGTVGLHARQIPLWLPRVHDCIALFLGSDAAYREQFARYPGTYYVTAGWVEEGMGAGQACASGEEREWEARHGAENAGAISSFMGSWKRNYQRAAFIDTGIGNRHVAGIAQRMASENGWRYEALRGSHDLLALLLSGREDERVLHVPPGFVTRFDSIARRLTNGEAKGTRSDRGDPRAGVGDQRSAGGDRKPSPRSGFGLGIDAGGTYTDAAVFDWGGERVLAKAKAPTSHWDYAIGIEAALAQLPPELLRQVEMVAVSTTLATNAIVEGKGQSVGLLLMPPTGDDVEAHIHHRPLQTIAGRMGIDGAPIEPVDAAAVRRVAAAMVEQRQVRAFAVTGYASHINPAHELEVKALLRDATGLPVTCGHELSRMCNYRVRAETAALNARIVPCLRALMERLGGCLDRRGIRAPLMVVRSDGSLMSIDLAFERPVETLLSGPAASVAGARFLCHLPDALVIDIGGTTSDTAVLRQGQVRTDPDGATVGHWRTHVRAMAVRTLGLGGDSEIRHDRQGWQVGPRRVTPVCRLGEQAAPQGIAACYDWLERQPLAAAEPGALTIYARLPTAAAGPRLSPRQQEVLARLERGPASAVQLAADVGCPKPAFLEIEPLVESQLVRSFGFTPTDALHLLGRMSFWDVALARRHAVLLGAPRELGPDELARLVEERVVRRVARELLMTRLVELTGTRSMEGESGFVARALLERGLGERRDDLSVKLALGLPVIGIGAPAAFFLPAAAQRLHAEALVPTDGDVANAIGAITSGIRVERSAELRADERGIFHVSGLAGAPDFDTIEEAQVFAEKSLREAVLGLAQRAGAETPLVELAVQDRVTTVGEGEELFIGRILCAVATGLPGRHASPDCGATNVPAH